MLNVTLGKRHKAKEEKKTRKRRERGRRLRHRRSSVSRVVDRVEHERERERKRSKAVGGKRRGIKKTFVGPS